MRLDFKIRMQVQFYDPETKETYDFKDYEVLDKCFNTEKLIALLQEKTGAVIALS
ncbi:hypothetical protein [Bartonella sp. CR84HXZ]|uniref:hypothetical protein n=1 Tax=Bartonella sp. CR84HXZ TaxID=1460997 RepID=UPI0035CEA96E